MSADPICENLKSVQERIARACERAGRNPDDVLLVAVSKTRPAADIEKALRCGQIHFGENRAQELQDKMEHLGPEIHWHMIGHLQTNKIKYLVERVNWIHSMPKKKSFKELQKRASRVDRVIDTLIQVNISGEDQKSGCNPDKLGAILDYAQGLSHVRVRGLMGIATLVEDPEEIRPEFRHLRELLEQHKSYECENIQLDQLSMGMTHDLEVAVEEGATMVRVGTAIFGERNYG